MINAKHQSDPATRIATPSVRQYLALIAVLFASFSTQAADSFWASPGSTDTHFSSSGLIGQNQSTELNLLNDGGQSTLAMTQYLGDGNDSLAVRYSKALQQRDLALGFTRNDFSLSYMAGSGEDYAELGGEYAGIDPYTFHGGWKQDFKYDGFAADYRFGKFGHLQYGQATVSSAGLADRSAKYMEWSNHRAFARATRFTRGGDHIGNGFDAGFAFGGNKQLAFQSVNLDNDRSMQRIRFQFDGAKTRQYWLDISAHQNALYRDNDDTRVMFTFRTLLGAPQHSLVSYADEVDGAADETGENGEDGKKKKRGVGRAVLIGVGVAAVAAASSSGSKEADQLGRFRTQRDAAFDVLNGINPTSVRENREHGGWVFANPDGSYASTAPVAGEAASVQLPDLNVVIPLGSQVSASYHTHGGFDPRYDNENFSQTDLRLDRELGVDGYLATPGGQFKWHEVSTNKVHLLGSIATE